MGKMYAPAMAHRGLRMRMLNHFKVDHLAWLHLLTLCGCTFLECQIVAYGLKSCVGRVVLLNEQGE